MAADLLRVYEMALDSDPALRVAQATRDSVAETRPQALAPLLPQVNADATLMRNSRDNRQNRYNYDQKTASLNVSQAILRFDQWVVLDRTKNIIAQADAQVVAADLNLMLRVAQSYFNILSAQDNISFSKAELEAIGRQLEQANQRFKVGLIPITDVHEAQAAYDGAKAALISADNDLDNAWEALREIVADLRDKHINGLRDNIPLSSPKPADVNAWVERAMQNNPEIIASSNASESARKNIKQQQAGHLPSLDLVAQVASLDISPNRYGSMGNDTSSIGLQLNIPLFAGGAVNSRTRQARHDYQASSDTLEQVRRAIKREVSDSYRGIVTSISRVEALKSTVRSAESALSATMAGFEVGTRTMVEVLDVQRNLFNARRNLAQARYDYILNGLKLKNAAGSLRSDDLRLVNSLLTKR
jgi:outer membrane protein